MKCRVTISMFVCLSCFAAKTHAATCTISTAGVAFATYDPTVVTAATMTGTVSLNCTYILTGASATLTLAAGSSGTFANRTMVLSARSLTYNLYLDAGHTQVFGDGTAGTATFTGCYLGLSFPCPGGGNTSGMAFAVPVYGLVPAGQDLPAGTYADTMVLTVTY